MTEEEWLRCPRVADLVVFLTSTQRFRTRWLGWREVPRCTVRARQWRLCSCACLARLERFLPRRVADPCARLAADYEQEQISEGELLWRVVGWLDLLKDAAEWTDFQADWLELLDRRFRAAGGGPAGCVVALGDAVRDALTNQVTGSFLPRETTSELENAIRAEQAAQADLLRDILGNPFRPLPTLDPQWQTWRGGLIPALAGQLHEERRYEDLPILGDMLEEAGCELEAVLAHCRGPGPHTRGCWVVEWVSGP